MSYEPGRKRTNRAGGGAGNAGGGTPGKRTLTQSLTRRSSDADDAFERTRGVRNAEGAADRASGRALERPQIESIEEHRATLPIDDGSMGDQTFGMSDRLSPRAPNDSPIGDDLMVPDWSDDASDLLTDAQASAAARRNPKQQDRLGFHPTEFSVYPVDSEAFAVDVAMFQREHGLVVDGIVGPATCAAAGIAIGNDAAPTAQLIDLGDAPDKLPLA
jgi:hypothetical protein